MPSEPVRVEALPADDEGRSGVEARLADHALPVRAGVAEEGNGLELAVLLDALRADGAALSSPGESGSREREMSLRAGVVREEVRRLIVRIVASPSHRRLGLEGCQSGSREGGDGGVAQGDLRAALLGSDRQQEGFPGSISPDAGDRRVGEVELLELDFGGVAGEVREDRGKGGEDRRRGRRGGVASGSCEWGTH